MEDFNNSLTNHSNSSIYSYCKYREPDTDLEKIAKRTASVLIALLGIFANVFVIILAAKYTVRKNLHHLIINMAVSDAAYLFSWLLYSIFLLTDFKYRNVDSGTVICEVLNFLNSFSYKVSLITLLVISIERLRATRRTLLTTRQYTFKKRMTVICVCWLIPSPYAGYYVHEVCVESAGEVFMYFRLADQTAVVFLSCVIIFFSIITMRRLSRPQAIHANLNEQQRRIRTNRAKAAVRMVLVSVLLYTCCWLPLLTYRALWSVDFFIPTVKIIDISVCIDWRSFSYIGFPFLPIVNSCFSPLIYIIFLTDFRQAAKKVFCRKDTQCQAPNSQNSILPELQAMPDRSRLPDFRGGNYDN